MPVIFLYVFLFLIVFNFLAADMVDHVLAVVDCKHENQIIDSHVLGFVIILKIDFENKIIKLLSPATELPGKFFIYSSSIIYDCKNNK